MDNGEHLDIADQLLSSRAHPAKDDLGRMHLRTKTMSIVGRQRRFHSAKWAAAVVMAYAAGWGSQVFMQSSDRVQPRMAVTETAPMANTPELETPEGVIELSELISRKADINADTNSYESLRRAGNYQLVERNDLTAALRLYHRAIKAATAADLNCVDANSTWLWDELKHDRNRRQPGENSNADQTL